VELNHLQLKFLKQIRQYRGRGPSVALLLLRTVPVYLVLAVLIAPGVFLFWTIGLGPNALSIPISLLMGMAIRDLGQYRAFVRAWPALEEVIDWRRAEELIRLNDPSATPTPSR
jgi:hypothetical protein